MSYTIAQAAEKFGVTAHTLRYYDKEGLLPFVQRTAGGIRIFTDTDFEWLALLTCLKNTGMTVKDIKQFIEWIKQGDASVQKRLDMFKEQKQKIQQEIDQLNLYMKRVDFKIWYYELAAKAGGESKIRNDPAFLAEKEKRARDLNMCPLIHNKK